MLTFLAIAIAGAVIIVGGAIFGGHDHDGGDHSFDHDHSHDGHDADHGHNMPTVSIFSAKVLGTFIMGFGGGGFLASYNGMNTTWSSLVGIGVGLGLGLFMYGIMRVLYSSQADSLIYTKEAVGKEGIARSNITENGVGEVEINYGDISKTYLARSNGAIAIMRGTKIRVAEYHGSELVVEPVVNQ